MATVVLHRNVQFIYERALALLELESFGATNLHDSPREPWVISFNSLQDFDPVVARSAYFSDVDGRASIYGQLMRPAHQGGEFNVTRSVNQYLTHWIYPYKGKFHPQMIRAIFNILHLSSDALILDPFSGSATTVLEATIYGADSIGVDVSPLCVLQGKVKTQAWKQNAQIVRLSDRILRQTSWRNAQRALDQNRQHDSEVVRDFFDLAWMVVLSDAAVRGREHERSLRRNLPRMVRSVAAMNEARKRFKLRFGKAAVRRGDVRNLAAVGLRPESVDAIVTSPPYSIALDYVKNDHHALSALGETPDKARQGFIGVRGKPKDRLALYEQDMREAFHQMARTLKPNSPAVVVVGDATRGMEMRTTREMIDWAAEAGLRLEMESPKTVYGLYNLIADEKILFFRKT